MEDPAVVFPAGPARLSCRNPSMTSEWASGWRRRYRNERNQALESSIGTKSQYQASEPKVPGSSRGFLTLRPWTWAMSMKRSSGEMPMSLWIACVSEMMKMRTTRTRTTIQNKNLRMETTHLAFRARMYLDTRSKAMELWSSLLNHHLHRRHESTFADPAGCSP